MKKVLFSDDKNTLHVHNICCSWIKIDSRCNFIVMILTRMGLHRQYTSFNIFIFQKWIEKFLELQYLLLHVVDGQHTINGALSQFQACVPSQAFVILLLPVVGICQKTSAGSEAFVKFF